MLGCSPNGTDLLQLQPALANLRADETKPPAPGLSRCPPSPSCATAPRNAVWVDWMDDSQPRFTIPNFQQGTGSFAETTTRIGTRVYPLRLTS